MWKRINWRAGAIFALAFVLFFAGAISPLATIGILVLGGVESVVEFVVVCLRQPPSLERFRQLNMLAGIAWVGLAGAGVLYLGEAPLGINAKTLDRVTNVGNAAILVGTAAHAFLVRFIVRRALRPRPGNPDFAEDKDGNPI